jgi:biotin operon repressor
MKTEVIQKMKAFMPYLNEEQVRLYVASEAKALGRGGKQLIENELGISHNTINRGIAELESPGVETKPWGNRRQRKEGGGRKRSRIIGEALST